MHLVLSESKNFA